MNVSEKLCQRRFGRSKSGFTLVELLVVIAIIGILVSLLLPAIQAARAAARRTQCQSSIKQLGLAVLNYESTHKALPPLMSWFDDPSSASDPGQWELGPNWVIAVLPYIEQQTTFDAFDFSVPITDPLNETVRGVDIPVMLCPEDSDNNSIKFSGSASPSTSQFGDNWARGNYGANGGLYYTPANATSAVDMRNSQWEDARFRGVLGANFKNKMSRITDGTSNTILIGEIRAGVADIDLRGTWAMSGACPSGLAAHGWFGDDNGPNNLELAGDDVVGCRETQKSFGRTGYQELARQKMGCSIFGPNWQQTVRSQHQGGAHVCLLDGSVQYISDDIQISQNNECCSTWDRLNLSADGEMIDSEAF